MVKKETASRGRKPNAWKLLTASKVRTLREGSGMSRKLLSEKLGVSSGAVQLWETGKNAPSEEVQASILRLFDPSAAPAPAETPVEAASAETAASPPAASTNTARPVVRKVSGELATAVATIVAALASRGEVSKDNVVESIRLVHEALST